jgi:hypothetical protein
MMAKFLVDARVDVNLQDHEGVTAQWYTIDYSWLTMAKLLVDAMTLYPTLITRAIQLHFWSSYGVITPESLAK